MGGECMCRWVVRCECMCVHMFACVCVCVCVCKSVMVEGKDVCMCVSLYMCICVCMYACVCLYVCMRVCVCVRTGTLRAHAALLAAKEINERADILPSYQVRHNPNPQL